MDEEQKYLFDINGYLVLRGVLSAAEVAEANAAIDHHRHLASTHGAGEKVGRSLSQGAANLVGTTGRQDLGDFLGWEVPLAMDRTS